MILIKIEASKQGGCSSNVFLARNGRLNNFKTNNSLIDDAYDFVH